MLAETLETWVWNLSLSGKHGEELFCGGWWTVREEDSLCGLGQQWLSEAIVEWEGCSTIVVLLALCLVMWACFPVGCHWGDSSPISCIRGLQIGLYQRAAGLSQAFWWLERWISCGQSLSLLCFFLIISSQWVVLLSGRGRETITTLPLVDPLGERRLYVAVCLCVLPLKSPFNRDPIEWQL